MAKTKAHKNHSPTPNADQLAAVRRLAGSGDLRQARQRLAALCKSFPDFKPLLGLAWEVEDRCNVPMLATARACEWQSAMPNSLAAVEALCKSAEAAGLAAVHARALQRLSVLEGRGEMPMPDTIEAEAGSMPLALLELIDLSVMHLADDKPAAAIALLQGVDHPSARNNLALALFISGDLVQARAVMEANWQAHPDNLYALERVVRWRCWAEGMDRCLGFAATFRHTTPGRIEDAIAQVAALRFLDDDKGVQQAWQAASQASWWKQADGAQRDLFWALKDPQARLPGTSAMWFPAPWIHALKNISSKPDGAGDNQLGQRWNALLDTCTAHADYLARAAELGDEATRILALAVLKRRAKLSNAPALASLLAMLKRPNGSDSDRTELVNWLTEAGLINKSESTEVWLAGSLRTVKAREFRINDEQHESPFSDVGTELHERIHAAINHGQLRVALALAQQLLKLYPEHPMALTNVAGIKQGLGHPQAEIIALYRQAHAIDPDYLFARCGLARCLAEKGQVEEAQALLVDMLERTDFHRSEYISLLLAQQALALASDEHEAGSKISELLKNLAKPPTH
ncbi:MAG: tetratricopeptide repeat protein [Rhodoferax sp.]